MDKLIGKDDLEKYAKGKMKSMPYNVERELARQLLDCMRENERLRVQKEWVDTLMYDLQNIVRDNSIVHYERIFAQSIIDSYPNKTLE